MNKVLVLLVCCGALGLAKNAKKCNSDTETLTIEGKFVNSSDIQPSKCSSMRVTKIDVFIVSTFYVDNELELDGYEEEEFS